MHLDDKNKAAFFVSDMIVYVGNSKNKNKQQITTELLEVIGVAKKHLRVQGYCVKFNCFLNHQK